MGNGKAYALPVAELMEADSTRIIKWTPSDHRDYLEIVQQSGNKFEIPWDDVLYQSQTMNLISESRI
jgi:hypothetical protein